VLNQRDTLIEFSLRGERLDLLKKLEVARGTAVLSTMSHDHSQRKLTLHMAPDLGAGTGLAMKAYIEDRSEPLTLADAVRIVGQRPASPI
jgi:hypothetical protein